MAASHLLPEQGFALPSSVPRPTIRRRHSGPAPITQDLADESLVIENGTVGRSQGGRTSEVSSVNVRPPSIGLVQASRGAFTQKPRNSSELALSLISLILPYDLRNTQRSLVSVQKELRALKASMSINSIETSGIRDAMAALQADIIAVNRAQANSGPDQSRKENLGIQGHLRAFEEHKEALTAKVDALASAVEEMHTFITESKEEAQMYRKLLADVGLLPANQSGQEERVFSVSYAQLMARKRATAKQAQEPHVDKQSLNIEYAGNEGNDSTASPDSSASPSEVADHSRRTRQSSRSSKQPTQPSSAGKPFERQATTQNGVAKQQVGSAKPTRRQAFGAYTKQFNLRFKREHPETSLEQKNFLWSYIDGMQDKELSAVLQDYMCRQFPDAIARSKGRGKPHRHVRIEKAIQWPQFFEAIKKMPMPSILVEG